MTLSSRLNNYDFFAIQPSLRIKGRDQMGSLLGFLLTFITFVSLFGLTIYLFVMMLLRNNPNVAVSGIMTNAFNGDNVTIAPNNSTFYFGFGLFTEAVVSDPEIVNITFSGYNFTYVPPNHIEPNNFSMNAVLCDWYNQHGQWGNQGYCLDKNMSLLSGLEGPDHAVVQSLNIEFSPCSRNTEATICKDRLKMNEIFRESAFRVTYSNPSINSNDYHNPITINYVNYEEYILPGFTKTLTFFVTKVKVITDSGWVFQRTKEIDAVIVEDQRTTIQPRYDENSSLFKFVITANDRVIVYNRSYTKIQDVFGDITGLASFIVLILALVVRPYFQFKTTEALVNSMYDVMIKEDAHSSVIGIVDNNSDNDNDDKKGPPGNGAGGLKKSTAMKKSISTRSKSRKIGIEEHASKTIGAYETQTTIKSEVNPSKRQEQPKEIDIVIPSEGPPQVSAADEKPVVIEENNNHREDNNGLIEIELETVEHTENNTLPAPDPGIGSIRALALASVEERCKIDISFREWVCSFFRPQLQVRILEEAEEMLSPNLDIVTIAKNISEINKLKECLLTDQQRILFNHLPHSFVLIDPVTHKKSSEEEKDDGRVGSTEENGEDKVKEAYKALKESKNKTAIDSKILSMYEKKCLNFSAVHSVTKDGT